MPNIWLTAANQAAAKTGRQAIIEGRWQVPFTTFPTLPQPIMAYDHGFGSAQRKAGLFNTKAR
jgi:hypothetical protein